MFNANDHTLIPLYRKVIPNLNGKFREAQKFRPLRIIWQMFCIQLAFWLTAAGFQLILVTLPSLIALKLARRSSSFIKIVYPSFELLFGMTKYSINSVETCLNSVSFLISGFISAYYLKFILKRSKLCLDFSVTCHAIHLLLVIIYNRHFPLNFVWWTLLVLSAWMMTERSRSLCIQQELLPISVNNGKSAKEQSSISSIKRILSRLMAMFKSKKTSNSCLNLHHCNTSKSPLNPK